MKVELLGFDDLDIFAQNVAVCELLNANLPYPFVATTGSTLCTLKNTLHSTAKPYEVAFKLLRNYAIQKSIRFESNGKISYMDDEPDMDVSIMNYLHNYMYYLRDDKKKSSI